MLLQDNDAAHSSSTAVAIPGAKLASLWCRGQRSSLFQTNNKTHNKKHLSKTTGFCHRQSSVTRDSGACFAGINGVAVLWLWMEVKSSMAQQNCGGITLEVLLVSEVEESSTFQASTAHTAHKHTTIQTGCFYMGLGQSRAKWRKKGFLPCAASSSYMTRFCSHIVTWRSDIIFCYAFVWFRTHFSYFAQ